MTSCWGGEKRVTAMNNGLKFAAWAALFALALYLFSSLFTGPGRDDQMLLDAVLTGLVLSGLLMVWNKLQEIEKKLEFIAELDDLLKEKKDEHER